MALGAGDVDRAEAMFRVVLSADPSCGLAQHGLGVSLLRQNRSADALSVMSALAAAYPEQPDALTGLSVSAFAAQDFAKAQAAAQEAVRLAPGSLEAVHALVSALLRQGAVGDAAQAVANAQGGVDGPSLACLEAQVLLESGQAGTAQQRLSYCRQSLHPELSAAVAAQLGSSATASAAAGVGADRLTALSQAVGHINAGRPAEAAALLDPVVAADGRRADARLIRARARRDLGDSVGARADLEAAFDGGTWVDVHRTGAMSGILRQSHAEALQGAIADGAAMLVQIHLEAGELDAARERLATAVDALGAQVPLSLAEARVERAAGEPARAWEAVLQVAAEPAARDLIGEWAIQEPGAAPAEALAVLAASARWSDGYNLAVVQHARRAYADCAQTARQAAQGTMDPAVSARLWGLGYRCAVSAEDLSEADRLYPLLRGRDVREVDRVNHARLRYRAGQPEATLVLLRGLSSPAVQSLAAALAIRAHGDLRQWSDAVDWSDAASAQERYWLGARLAENGRLTDARLQLSAACTQLVAEDAARCSQLLAQLGGPL